MPNFSGASAARKPPNSVRVGCSFFLWTLYFFANWMQLVVIRSVRYCTIAKVVTISLFILHFRGSLTPGLSVTSMFKSSITTVRRHLRRNRSLMYPGRILLLSLTLTFYMYIFMLRRHVGRSPELFSVKRGGRFVWLARAPVGYPKVVVLCPGLQLSTARSTVRHVNPPSVTFPLGPKGFALPRFEASEGGKLCIIPLASHPSRRLPRFFT
jgi:hypothetical protein